MSVRTSIDGEWLPADVQNISIGEENTEEYFVEYVVQGSGAQIVQVNINNQPAALSPVVLQVLRPPLRQIDCPPGREANADGICIPCDPGRASSGGGAPCRACDPGTFQPFAEQTNCEACPVGTAQAEASSTSCEPCAPGFSSRGKTGSLVCTTCAPGHEAPYNGSERCSLCPRGSYSEVDGAATCTPCGGGKGTVDQGSTDPSLCICLPDEFLARAAASLQAAPRCSTG